MTRELAAEIYQRVIAAAPEIKVYSYSLGQADSDNAFASMQNNGTNIISVNIDCGSMEERVRTSSEISDDIRAILNSYPQIKKFTVTEGGMGMGGST